MIAGVRLVVSDVDGTLVDKNKDLTPATVAAVERLAQAGIPFTIISARPVSGLRPIIDTLDLDVPVGAFNGGLVFSREQGVIEHHVVPADVAQGIVAMIGDAPVDRWCFAHDRWYASSATGSHVDSERRASNQEPVVVADFAPYLESCDKLTFVSDDEPLLRALAERVKARFGGEATIAQSQTYYLDVTATRANKGDGVATLAATFAVPLADTLVIGDQANDLPMFARAGHAVAMGQAPDNVRAAAQAVTTANDADGVAHAIDTLILGAHS